MQADPPSGTMPQPPQPGYHPDHRIALQPVLHAGPGPGPEPGTGWRPLPYPPAASQGGSRWRERAALLGLWLLVLLGSGVIGLRFLEETAAARVNRIIAARQAPEAAPAAPRSAPTAAAVTAITAVTTVTPDALDEPTPALQPPAPESAAPAQPSGHGKRSAAGKPQSRPRACSDAVQALNLCSGNAR